MSAQSTSSAYAMVMGAFVADAAALGFHWLYDQQRIRELAPESPQFHPINKRDYADVAGYFAHEVRRDGDLSQYGEQFWTLVKSLSETAGVFSQTHYGKTFRDHFGYGGRYVGYIDRPTRDTLDNITRDEAALLARANDLPFGGTAQEHTALLSKVKSYSQTLTGAALRKRLQSVIGDTENNAESITHAFALCDLIEQKNDFHGADDQQLPALSKLPALAVLNALQDNYLATVESAVRVTNNNDTAVHYATATARLLKHLYDGRSLDDAIADCRAQADAAIATSFSKIDSATGLTTADAVKEFGMACDLDYAFPSILFILQNTSSYEEAVIANIYAGGDSCGRAIIIGAAAATLYSSKPSNGIPVTWVEKLNDAHELNALTQELVDYL